MIDYRGYNHRAHGLVDKAIKNGTLKKLNGQIMCVDCKSAPATQYDHRDYLKPLEVDPVCRECNRLRGPAKSIPSHLKVIGRPPVITKYTLPVEETKKLILDLAKKSGSYARLGERIQPHKPITRQAIYAWLDKGRIPDSRIMRCLYLLNHWEDSE